MLDSLNNNFSVTHYTLSTKELYGINKKIEIYNVPMWKGEFLLLLSVLPSFTENDNWSKINYDSFKGKIVALSQIRNYTKSIYNSHSIDFENINTLNFGLIKKVGGDYYLSNICLAERFNVRNFPFPLMTGYKTINIGNPIITICDFQKQLPSQYLTPMNPEEKIFIMLDRNMLENQYLSKKSIIGKDTAYQFWTFTDWSVSDGWNKHRGVDRFIYVPGKGIVGGSYDFWFAFKPPLVEYKVKGMPVKAEKLWDNIINEKVMIAEELK